MKIGVRTPSINKSIAARLSWRRALTNALGLRMPRGWGWVRNPKRAVYGYVYRRTTISFWDILRRIFKALAK